MRQDLGNQDQERLHAASWLPDVGPFTAFGRSWTLRTDDAALAELVADLYADLLLDPAVNNAEVTDHLLFQAVLRDGHERSLIMRDSERTPSGETPASAMSSLVWNINRWILDEASRDHLLLHAGGVVGENGIAIVFPAPSGSGKSTLTTGLLDRGFFYLSDEAVALHANGTVTGYAKPVSIDRGAWGVLVHHQPQRPANQSVYLERQWHVRASRISRTVKTATLGAIVFPRYAPQGEPSLSRIGQSEALLRAGACTLKPEHSPTVELAKVQNLALALTGLPAFELVVTELDEACRAVVRLFRGLQKPPLSDAATR